MTSSDPALQEAISRLTDEVAKNTALLKLLVRERSSSAIELIVELAKKTPGTSIDSRELERELQKSRNWTISLMRKASLLNPNLKFLPGDSAKQTPHRVVWLERADVTKYAKLQTMVEKVGQLTLKAVAEFYGVERKTARMVMDTFCEQCRGFEVVELPGYFAGQLNLEDGIVIRHLRGEGE